MKLTRRGLLRWGGASLLVGAGGAAYTTLIEPESLAVERVEAPIAGLPPPLEGLRIAVLSDFHLHPYTRLPHIERAVRMANELRPDVVLLLGDFVDSRVDAVFELAPALARLNARLGVFGILGNHDHWKGAGIVQNALRREGIPIFRNTGVAIPVGVASLFLAGLDSAWASHPNLPLALATRKAESPVIVMMHEPDYADTLVKDGRVSLQLSGHSHGGQVRLPLVGALDLPSWGRRYDQGLYRLQEMLLYTNRGIGMVGVPVRFNCPPEITEITLRVRA